MNIVIRLTTDEITLPYQDTGDHSIEFIDQSELVQEYCTSNQA